MKTINGSIVKWTGDILFWLFIASVIAEGGNLLSERNQALLWSKNAVYTESNRHLQNPNTGFYTIYGYIIKDEYQDFTQQNDLNMINDTKAMSLIQINLVRFKEGNITEQGLANIESLFSDLEKRNKQYIVRFLYDWDGRAMDAEPKDIRIILNHMNQLKDILAEYSHMIFTFQGIFVGNYGEMHGSAHLSEEDMKALINQLLLVTPETTYLSVRTPQHWRILTEIAEKEEFGSTELSERLGLYNDGILGTESDTGTYGTTAKEEVGLKGKWTRKEELEFQSELCKLVPNGGEVIIENPWNDFENAVEAFEEMHITYLNWQYDRKILNKWAESEVAEEGCFNEMDGLTYMERHLGYRLLLEQTSLDYDFWSDILTITLNMKNVGFAPLYKEPEKQLVICEPESGQVWTYSIMTELRSLAGGIEKEQVLAVTEDISLADFNPGEYEVYFHIQDPESGWDIELANEQEKQEFGYLIGNFKIEQLFGIKKFIEQYELETWND